MNINDRELLARTLQAEAGNQGYGGMLAAGSVIMNRANTSGYGNGLRGVILKPGQFSAWNSMTGYAGGEQGQDMASMRASDEAYKAADALISGAYDDVTGGATHYYNPAISQPKWGQKSGGDWKQIGDHVFGFADAGRKPNPNQAIASDTMRAIGKSPKGILATTQTSETETKPMIQQQKSRGLLESLGIQKMQEGAEGEAGQRFFQRDTFKDTAARMAPLLASMGSSPALQKATANIAAQRTEGKARNRTIEYLRKSGRADLADAVESGSLGVRDAAGIIFSKSGDAPSAFQALAYQARAAGLQEGSPEYQEFMLSGGGAPATYRALKMQAEAAGFQEGTPEFQEFMATRGAGLQAGARQTATNVANVATGGEAAQAISAGTEAGKKVVQEGSELSEMQRNIQGLRVTIDQLSALSDAATYTSLGQVGNEIRKQLGLGPSEGAVARTEYIAVVNNQILPLLRETFGAAFTAAEGDTLRKTLGDPNKTPAEKKVVLKAFIAQKERDLAARQGGPAPSAPSATGGDDPLGLRN